MAAAAIIEVANFIEVQVPNLFYNYFGTLLDLLQGDLTSFLASERPFRPRSGQGATKSREVPRHIKSDERLV